MSSNQWNQAPAGQGAPQGQPPMGYPGAMPPEKKSKTGLYVGLGCGCLVLLALLIGVIALAVMLMGGDDPKDSGDGGTTTSAAAPAPGQNNGGGDNPAPDPAPNGGGDNPAPNPAPAPNGGSDNPAPAPDGGNSNLPQQVGEYTLGEVATDNVVGADYGATYTSSTGQIIVSGAENPITTIEDEKNMLTLDGNAQEISGWTCGPFYGGASGNESICVKSTNGTNVIKVIGDADAQTLANFGEQFISAGGAS
ncbi:hypothetical protein [Dermabacter sp. HSID17554]|uniref:hypothetical protein n=1 Tax=Dermabacter sp. HSID17554 TaxID=2419511 RepID=UPI000F88ACA6|nr:hypothetical protein [Dermabacter sp. HSID17554]